MVKIYCMASNTFLNLFKLLVYLPTVFLWLCFIKVWNLNVTKVSLNKG